MSMVIIGSGETGVAAARTLREQGYVGPLTLFGAEPGYPYERPPLSKEALTRRTDPPAITGSEVLQDINFRPGVRVRQVDRTRRQVLPEQGAPVPYEKLLLATGARARSLSLPGLRSDDVLLLRTREDAERIRQVSQRAEHAILVGGGFIGLELAASLTELGLKVTVVEAQERLLKRAVPAAIADRLHQEHLAHGITLHCSARIERAERSTGGYTLTLASGEGVRGDTLIAGVGAVPDTALAESSGLDVDNGIAVNEMLQTSDPSIFAAGDCCSFPHALYNNERIRLESWRCAQEQGALVAGNLLGAQEAYKAAPWFWSDQFDLSLQIAGLPAFAEQTVERPMPERSRLLFFLDGSGRLVAASGIAPGNAIAREIRVAEKLINLWKTPDPDALADPSFKLKSLLKQ